MQFNNHIVIGISSGALFDTREADAIYRKNGKDAFIEYQLANEKIPFNEGPAFPFVKAMFALNELQDTRRVEVVILSQNEPETAPRIANSIDHHDIPITRAAYTGGTNVAKYLKAFSVDLFLSRNEEDVKSALSRGVASAVIFDSPDEQGFTENQLRIAFDGDAVLFSPESEQIYKEKGKEAFFEHEKANASNPMQEGPFAPFLRLLYEIQSSSQAPGIPPIRTALVTARNKPADSRVFQTLRAWGIKVNESFFLGGLPKREFLKEFRPHIFFDDQETHIMEAQTAVPSARVPISYLAPAKRPELATINRLSYPPTTKEKFERECRRIFQQYSSQSRVLPIEYREFISRNKDRPPSQRGKIIANLSKFDISTSGEFKPYFNRERNESVTAKLKQIESDATDE